MANYDWREYQGRSWFDRFPEGVRGYTAWRRRQFESGRDLRTMEGDIKQARERVTVAPSQPCVFVSHRRSDEALARRVAFLACQEGFDYWLDVVDPNLSGVTGVTVTSKGDKAAATAAIIEMALLNSTHVVAIITANTKGSEWVPYEYGRVKTPQSPTTLQAACWTEPGIGFDLPGYLYLGEIHRSETDIKQWFRTELRKRPGGITGPCGWSGPVPDPL